MTTTASGTSATLATSTALPSGMVLDDVVSTLASVDQAINQMMAIKMALLAAGSTIADDEPFESVDSREMAHRAVATEFAAVLRVSDRTVEAQMGDAAALGRDFPETAAAFGRGEISHAHVRIILAAGQAIEAPQRGARFEELVLPRALVDSPNRLRPFAKQAAETVREVSFTERHREARERRGVWVRDGEDGMAYLIQHGPAALIRAEHDRLTEMAAAQKAENVRLSAEAETNHTSDDFADERTMAQLRCDLLADLVLTGVPTGHTTADGLLGEITAHIDITVPFTALTDPDDLAAPGHLEGLGPIDPETARILVWQTPGFDRVLTDPVSGVVLGVDRYRPSTEMRRYLRARDRRCRFPGCRLLARLCDQDHSVAYAAGGETAVGNLADLCRRHHMTKHHTPWRVRQLGGGVLEWTSPTGRIHVDGPPGVATHVTFEEIEERMPLEHPPF